MTNKARPHTTRPKPATIGLGSVLVAGIVSAIVTICLCVWHGLSYWWAIALYPLTGALLTFVIAGIQLVRHRKAQLAQPQSVQEPPLSPDETTPR